MRRFRRSVLVRCAVAVLACGALVGPASAVAAWEEVAGGASPVNVDPAGVSGEVSFANVGGVPHVAWREDSGSVGRIWVKRLSASGTAWERVGGTSPLNIDDTKNAREPSLADIGGVPWVAWTEVDGVTGNREVRVARLVGAGWQELGGGASPINVDPTKDAFTPSLAAVGGVAYVAWSETVTVLLSEIHVARLGVSGAAWEEVGTALNSVPSHSAVEPSLADVGGVPYVAWIEDDLTNFEARVARLVGGNWAQPEPGTSPINHSPTQSAQHPKLAVIGGVPHIAWLEDDGAGRQVRVSRLNAAGTDWSQIATGSSSVNRSPVRDATRVSLAGIGATPYVAWIESDGVNDEARVSRLGASGVVWEEVAPSVSPLNASPTLSASHVGMAGVGGIPWVAWSEAATGGATQARVGRLEPEFGTAGAVTTVNGTLGATLFGSARTYGLPYQVGFAVTGPGAGDTGLAPTSGDLALLQRDVSGLAPVTVYSYRPFATAGVTLPRVLGPVGSFTTLTAKTTISPPSVTTDALVASWVDRVLRTRAGTRVRLRYVSTRAGRATLELRRGSRLVRRFRATPRAGLNAFTILAPTAGAYRLILTVTTTDAKTARATGRLIVRKR